MSLRLVALVAMLLAVGESLVASVATADHAEGDACAHEPASDAAAHDGGACASDHAHEGGDECPPDCPPGCDEACACCALMRGDTGPQPGAVEAAVSRRVAFTRFAQVAPRSAELEGRDAVPRAG